MCSFCGQFCPQVLANLLGCCRCGKAAMRGGIRPDSMLTPYELEQLPLMLRELDKANRHFWQMVCWRLEQQQQQQQQNKDGGGKKSKSNKEIVVEGGTAGGGATTMMAAQQRTTSKGIIIDDSYADGCALRELARKLAKTLCENGGIGLDADAEQMLHDYRKRLLGEEWPKMVSSSSSAAAGGNSTSSKERLERRRGDFAQKGRAISFNGGLVAAMGAKGMEGSGNGNNVGNDGGGEAAKSKTSSSSGCSTTSSSGYSSEASTGNNRKARATAWLRHRANSVRGRSARQCCCQALQRIAQLGQLLNAEFHSTVFAHPEQFDVYERELKLLVWRRFTQLLVTLLNERGNGKAENAIGQQQQKTSMVEWRTTNAAETTATTTLLVA